MQAMWDCNLFSVVQNRVRLKFSKYIAYSTCTNMKSSATTERAQAHFSFGAVNNVAVLLEIEFLDFFPPAEPLILPLIAVKVSSGSFFTSESLGKLTYTPNIHSVKTSPNKR
jgi:hypothetical protein